MSALGCGVLMAVPFWIGRFVPLLDLPQHLALTTVLVSPPELRGFLATHFAPQWGQLTPYWVPYLVLRGLAVAVPVEMAARLYLTLYALLFPLAGVALARAFGRPHEAGLLVAPLALNANLYYGFIHYSSAVVLLLVILALMENAHPRPRIGRIAALAAAGCVLFFTHVQVLLFLLLVAPVMALARSDRAQRRSRLLALIPALLPAAALVVVWLLRTLLAGKRRDFGRLGTGLHARFEPLSERLLGIPSAVAGSFADGSDTVCLVLWAAMLVLLALLARAWSPSGAHAKTSRRVTAFALLAGAGYLLAPHSIMGQWNIAPRFALLAFIALPVLLPACPVLRWRRLAAIAALLLSALTGLNAARHHRAFDREAGAFDRVLASIPRGGHLLGLAYENTGSVLTRWPYLHFAHYYTVRGGGIAAGSFAAAGPIPVRLLRPGSLPHPDAFAPQAFRCPAQAPPYDYVLARGGPRLDGPGCPLELTVTRDGWWLYRVRASRGAPAPVDAGAATLTASANRL